MEYGLKIRNYKDNHRKYGLQNEDSKSGMSRMVVSMLVK
jgi:hypothetical protein